MNLIRLLVLLIMSQLGTFYHAATAITDPTRIIYTIITEPNTFGGCLAQINLNLVDYGLNCPSAGNSFVTFSCSGEFIPKDIAYRMFESAQTALVLKNNVRLYVDDSRKHNNICLAYRLDSFPPAG